MKSKNLSHDHFLPCGQLPVQFLQVFRLWDFGPWCWWKLKIWWYLWVWFRLHGFFLLGFDVTAVNHIWPHLAIGPSVTLLTSNGLTFIHLDKTVSIWLRLSVPASDTWLWEVWGSQVNGAAVILIFIQKQLRWLGRCVFGGERLSVVAVLTVIQFALIRQHWFHLEELLPTRRSCFGLGWVWLSQFWGWHFCARRSNIRWVRYRRLLGIIFIIIVIIIIIIIIWFGAVHVIGRVCGKTGLYEGKGLVCIRRIFFRAMRLFTNSNLGQIGHCHFSPPWSCGNLLKQIVITVWALTGRCTI